MKSWSIVLLLCVFAGCSIGEPPEADLSKENIRSISCMKEELNAPRVALSPAQCEELAKMIADRDDSHDLLQPQYEVWIDLKNGGTLFYFTDGINFYSGDNSCDPPYRFRIKENFLAKILHLKL